MWAILSGIAKKLFDGIGGIVSTRKDLVQTEESKLKIEALEHEKRERESQIQHATLDDVKQYDPKYRQLQQTIYIQGAEIHGDFTIYRAAQQRRRAPWVSSIAAVTLTAATITSALTALPLYVTVSLAILLSAFLIHIATVTIRRALLKREMAALFRRIASEAQTKETSGDIYTPPSGEG